MPGGPEGTDPEGDGGDRDERVLARGWQTDLREAGGVVHHSAGPQRPTVIALLEHPSLAQLVP